MSFAIELNTPIFSKLQTFSMMWVIIYVIMKF